MQENSLNGFELEAVEISGTKCRYPRRLSVSEVTFHVLFFGEKRTDTLNKK